MQVEIKIYDYASYQVCKKFHKGVSHVSDYLIKTVGVDSHETKKKIARKIKHGKVVFMRTHKRISKLLHALLIKRRKKVGTRKSKKKQHEHAQSI